MKTKKSVLFLCVCICLCGCQNPPEKSYHMDGSGISQEVLQNYMERSVTMMGFLMQNTRSAAMPIGLNLEETIKELWSD